MHNNGDEEAKHVFLSTCSEYLRKKRMHTKLPGRNRAAFSSEVVGDLLGDEALSSQVGNINIVSSPGAQRIPLQIEPPVDHPIP